MKQSEYAELLIHLEEVAQAVRAAYEANPTEDNDRKASTLEAAYDIVNELYEASKED